MCWEERGARNHIWHDAVFRVGEASSHEALEPEYAEKNQEMEKPRIVTNRVRYFKVGGR